MPLRSKTRAILFAAALGVTSAANASITVTTTTNADTLVNTLVADPSVNISNAHV